jgi:hypothetical protein
MDAPERGALLLVRFIGIGLILVSLLMVTLVFAAARTTPVELLPCILKAVPGLAGLGILAKTRAIAEWLDDLLDG